MKNKFIIRLLLLVAVSISLYSCVHDEISSSSDPASKEYQSKSLWKEDEIYIKNVMQVYKEHEAEIQKLSGTPLWDYAMTMGYMNESFLIVPVSVNNKIVSCIQVPRYGDVIRFVYDDDPEKIKFFQAYTTAKYRKAIKQKLLDNQNAKGGRECSFTSISVWLPDSPSDPDGPGHWQTNYMTNCQGSDGGGGMNDGVCSGYYDTAGNCVPLGPTYPYPGGGSGNPQQNQTPCAKTKSNLTNPLVKANIDDLKTKTTGTVENAYKFKSDGTPSNLIVGGKHNVEFGDKTGYQGGYHNHTTGTPMFSPADIEQLLQFALAQPTSNPANASNAYLGMVAPNGIHYVIQFNGNYNDALATFSQQQLDSFSIDYQILKNDLTAPLLYGNTYVNSDGSINSLGVETLFFETLKNMGLDGKVNLQRIENDGTVKTIGLDSNNQPASTTCS